MSRILYLVRHAQAVSGTIHLSDKDRALTERGTNDAINVGMKLQSENSNINLIVSSPAARAQATARLIAKQISLDITMIQLSESIYSSDKIEIVKLLNTVDESAKTILLVGHYPTIIELHNYLSSTKSLATMDTAELCALKFEMPWSEISEASGLHEFCYHPHLSDQ